MAAGVRFGLLHTGALTEGYVLSLYPNLAVSDLGTMMPPSTSAHQLSEPIQILQTSTRPSFYRVLGQALTCVTAQVIAVCCSSGTALGLSMANDGQTSHIGLETMM